MVCFVHDEKYGILGGSQYQITWKDGGMGLEEVSANQVNMGSGEKRVVEYVRGYTKEMIAVIIVDNCGFVGVFLFRKSGWREGVDSLLKVKDAKQTIKYMTVG